MRTEHAWLAAWLVAAAVCVASAPAAAQRRPDRLPIVDILKAQSCYSNLDYRCVVDILAPLPDWYLPQTVGGRPEGLSAADVPVALEAARILALSHLALGANARARLVFAWMLRVDPDYDLTGSEVSPSSHTVFVQVRARLFGPRLAHYVAARAVANVVVGRRRSRAVAIADRIRARLDATTVPTELTVRFIPRVGSRWVMLTGEDAQKYSDALSLELGMDVLIDRTGWSFGFTIGYEVHDVELTDLLVGERNQLEVLHIVGRVGYEWRWGPLGLRPIVGLGPTAFGTRELFEAVGLTGLVGVDLLGHLGQRLVLTAQVAQQPTLVFTNQSVRVSDTWLLGGALGVRF